MSQQTIRINERITAHRVILINTDGTNQGEVAKFFALQKAKDEGLDLVEVKSDRIPICKLMDYGKYCYQKTKSEKHKHAPTLKEMWFKFNTDSHDLEIKKRKIKEFLRTGHKVLVGMKLSGREKYVSGSKEKFFNAVKEFSETMQLNDISESDSSFSITLHP